MITVYVAGPYRGKTKEDVDRNINNAKEAALELWEIGYAVICPHMNAAHFKIPDDIILPGDMELLKRCDVMYCIDGWELSPGTRNEIHFAKEHNIPIVFSVGELAATAKKRLLDPRLKELARLVDDYWWMSIGPYDKPVCDKKYTEEITIARTKMVNYARRMLNEAS